MNWLTITTPMSLADETVILLQKALVIFDESVDSPDFEAIEAITAAFNRGDFSFRAHTAAVNMYSNCTSYGETRSEFFRNTIVLSIAKLERAIAHNFPLWEITRAERE